MKIAEYVSLAAERGASDIHLIAGLPAKCRLDGQIVNLSEEVLAPEDCERLAREMAGVDYEKIESIGELDCAATIARAYQSVPAAGPRLGGAAHPQ